MITMNEITEKLENEQFLEKRAVESWDKVVGPLIAKYTQKVSSKNGILTIKVLNSALRFELMGMKSEIIRKSPCCGSRC